MVAVERRHSTEKPISEGGLPKGSGCEEFLPDEHAVEVMTQAPLLTIDYGSQVVPLAGLHSLGGRRLHRSALRGMGSGGIALDADRQSLVLGQALARKQRGVETQTDRAHSVALAVVAFVVDDQLAPLGPGLGKGTVTVQVDPEHAPVVAPGTESHRARPEEPRLSDPQLAEPKTAQGIVTGQPTRASIHRTTVEIDRNGESRVLVDIIPPRHETRTGIDRIELVVVEGTIENPLRHAPGEDGRLGGVPRVEDGHGVVTGLRDRTLGQPYLHVFAASTLVPGGCEIVLHFRGKNGRPSPHRDGVVVRADVEGRALGLAVEHLDLEVGKGHRIEPDVVDAPDEPLAIVPPPADVHVVVASGTELVLPAPLAVHGRLLTIYVENGRGSIVSTLGKNGHHVVPETVVELVLGGVSGRPVHIDPKVVSIVEANPPPLAAGIAAPVGKGPPANGLGLNPEGKRTGRGSGDALVTIDADVVVTRQHEGLTESASCPLVLSAYGAIPRIPRHIGGIAVKRPPSLQIVEPRDPHGGHEGRDVGPVVHPVQAESPGTELMLGRVQSSSSLRCGERIPARLIGHQAIPIQGVESPPADQIGGSGDPVVVGDHNRLLLVEVEQTILHGACVDGQENPLRVTVRIEIESVGRTVDVHLVAGGSTENRQVVQVETRYVDRVSGRIPKGDGDRYGGDVTGPRYVYVYDRPEVPEAIVVGVVHIVFGKRRIIEPDVVDPAVKNITPVR